MEPPTPESTQSMNVEECSPESTQPIDVEEHAFIRQSYELQSLGVHLRPTTDILNSQNRYTLPIVPDNEFLERYTSGLLRKIKELEQPLKPDDVAQLLRDHDIETSCKLLAETKASAERAREAHGAYYMKLSKDLPPEDRLVFFQFLGPNCSQQAINRLKADVMPKFRTIKQPAATDLSQPTTKESLRSIGAASKKKDQRKKSSTSTPFGSKPDGILKPQRQSQTRRQQQPVVRKTVHKSS